MYAQALHCTAFVFVSHFPPVTWKQKDAFNFYHHQAYGLDHVPDIQPCFQVGYKFFIKMQEIDGKCMMWESW